MNQMQVKSGSDGFDVCLFDKKLNMHINSQPSISKEVQKPTVKTAPIRFRNAGLMCIHTLPLTLSAFSVIVVLWSDFNWVCSVYAIAMVVLPTMIVYVACRRVQLELLAIQCACVLSLLQCPATVSLSWWVLVVVLCVFLVEFWYSKMYLCQVLMGVQMASILSLLVFRGLHLFVLEIETVQAVIAATTPVVLGCVWYSQSGFAVTNHVST